MLTSQLGEPSSDQTDFGALLSLFTDTGTAFVVVGPHAVRAHGGLLPRHDHHTALQITPDPRQANLTALAHALARLGSLRLAMDTSGPGPEIRPNAQLFRSVPVLPLVTDVAELIIVLHPIGGPASYAELEQHTVELLLDGTPVHVPTLPGLQRGLAGGWRYPGADLMAVLRSLAQHAGARQLEHETVDIHALVDTALRLLSDMAHPATVRELLQAAGPGTAVRYPELRAAADLLVARGQVVRIKCGNAYRYSVSADPVVEAAHAIAELLRAIPDPAEVTDQALRLLGGNGRDVSPGRQAGTAMPGAALPAHPMPSEGSR